MTHEAAAVFAQVIPVLFIACYLTGDWKFGWFTPIVITVSAIVEIILLNAVATATTISEAEMYLVWLAIGGLIVTLLASAFRKGINREQQHSERKPNS